MTRCGLCGFPSLHPSHHGAGVCMPTVESMRPTSAGRALAERVMLWRELETLVRSLSGGVIPVGCLIDVVLRKLAALDEKGRNDANG